MISHAFIEIEKLVKGKQIAVSNNLNADDTKNI